MSKGVAHGSADGPRMIYGRENVNWGGPKQAGNLDSVSDNPMDDYDDNGFLEIKTDLEHQIEDLQERYPEDEMIQKYGKPTNYFDIHQSLRRLHEMFPAASLDSDTSPVRAGKLDFMNAPLKNSIPDRLEHKGSFFISSHPESSTIEQRFNAFRNRVDYSVELAKSKSLKKDLLELRDKINDPHIDNFDVLEQCIEHIEKPFRGSAKAEYAVLDDFMSAMKETDKSNKYSLDDAKKAIAKYRKINDEMIGANVPYHMREEFSDVSEIMRNRNVMPEEMQKKVNEMFSDFVESMEIVAPLYGDEPELDDKLDGVIGKLINQFKNDFYYEALVKDHLDANNIALHYGVQPEYDRWEDGTYDTIGSSSSGTQINSYDPIYYKNKIKEGSIPEILDAMRDFTPPKIEKIELTPDMSYSDLSYISSRSAFATREDYKKAGDYYKEVSKQRDKRVSLKKMQPITVTTVDNSKHSSPADLIEKSFAEAVRRNNGEDWEKYELFVQEVEKLKNFPSSGVRSNVQKSAIIQKLHDEIIEGKVGGVYNPSTSADTHAIADQLYRDSLKEKVTQDKLSAIDDLI